MLFTSSHFPVTCDTCGRSRSVGLIAAALFVAGCRGGAPSSSTSALPPLFAKGTYYSVRDPRVEVVFLTSNGGFVALPNGAGSVVSPGVPRHRYFRFTYSLTGESLEVTFDSPEGTLKSKRISVKNVQSQQASTHLIGSQSALGEHNIEE